MGSSDTIAFTPFPLQNSTAFFEKSIPYTSHPFSLFNLLNNNYAIPVNQTSEVIEYIKPTLVPDMKEFIKGIINIRGEILPIVNLRQKFALKEADNKKESVIIICKLSIDKKIFDIGVIVDKVEGVKKIEENKILSVPEIGSSYNPEFIKGIYNQDNNNFIILDLIKIFSTYEISQIIKNNY